MRENPIKLNKNQWLETQAVLCDNVNLLLLFYVYLYVVSDLIYACAGFLVFVEILSGRHATNYRIRTPLICLITALFCA